MSADEILEMCNRCARWITHDEQSAEAAANGAAAHIILKLSEVPEDYEVTHWKRLCKDYVKAAYKREHVYRDARVSLYSSEATPADFEGNDDDLLSLISATRSSDREIERIIEYREMKEELETLIEELPANQRKLIRLYFDGYKTKQIAEILGITEKLVRVWATKARHALIAARPDVGKYTEFLLQRRPKCNPANYFKRARQDETDRYIRQGKRTHAGYSVDTLL
jgi:RNA polymerase sigma factor (sigma-70 family)